jgi:hypothetical protein
MSDTKSWHILFTDGSEVILQGVPPNATEAEVRKEIASQPKYKGKVISKATPPGGADKPVGPGTAEAPPKVPPQVPPKEPVVPPKVVPPKVVPPKKEEPPKETPPAPPVRPPKETPAPAPDDSVINDIVKQKEAEARAKAEQAKKEAAEAADRARKSKEDADRQEALKKQEEARIAQQKAEQAKKEADAAAEKERIEKERRQNQPAPVVPPKKEEPPKETPQATTPATPQQQTPPATTTTPQKEEPPAKTKEQKRAEVEAKLQELEKSNDPAVRAQAAAIRKKLNKEGGAATQQTDAPPATAPVTVNKPADQISGTSDKPTTNTGPGKTGEQPGNNQGPGKTSTDGTKPGDGTGNKADGGKGKDGPGTTGPGTGTTGQGYWKDIGDNMVMWKGAPGTDSTFPGQSFKNGDIMPNPKYTVPTGGKGDDKYSSNNAEELRRQNRLKDDEIRILKLRAGIK